MSNGAGDPVESLALTIDAYLKHNYVSLTKVEDASKVGSPRGVAKLLPFCSKGILFCSRNIPALSFTVISCSLTLPPQCVFWMHCDL